MDEILSTPDPHTNMCLKGTQLYRMCSYDASLRFFLGITLPEPVPTLQCLCAQTELHGFLNRRLTSTLLNTFLTNRCSKPSHSTLVPNLNNALEDKWAEIPKATLQNLVTSFPTSLRCRIRSEIWVCYVQQAHMVMRWSGVRILLSDTGYTPPLFFIIYL